jgi:pentose-5-phosphate-3-epimerase
VDGGITKANIEHVATLGADLVVSGSAIYDGVAPLDNARYMLDVVRKSCTSNPS